VKKTAQPILLVDPRAADSAELREVARPSGSSRGLTKFPITRRLKARSDDLAGRGRDGIDLETPLPAAGAVLLSHGVDVPAEHAAARLTTVTRDALRPTVRLAPGDRRLFACTRRRTTSARRAPTSAVPYKGTGSTSTRRIRTPIHVLAPHGAVASGAGGQDRARSPCSPCPSAAADRSIFFSAQRVVPRTRDPRLTRDLAEPPGGQSGRRYWGKLRARLGTMKPAFAVPSAPYTPTHPPE